MRHGRTTCSASLRVLLIAAAACALVAVALPARAVSLTKAIVTVAPNNVMQYAIYSIAGFRTGNGETVTGYQVTFPVGIDAWGATSPGAGDLVTVDPADRRTVRVTLGTPYPQRTTFSMVFGNILNPSAPGSYAFTQATVFLSDGTQQVLPIKTRDGTFTIVPAPYISLTVTTPDPGQTVAFGQIDPGIATAGRTVTLVVDSSAPYTITRGIGGDSALMGLNVAGVTAGPWPGGILTHTDTYSLSPPWTTDPSIPLAASVTYTVTQ